MSNLQLLQKANIIKEFREKAIQNDSPELQKKRQAFMDFLNGRCISIPQVFEMYNAEETIYGKKYIGQYLWEVKFANTRTQLLTEVRAETDKLEFNKAIELICQICLELIKRDYNFSIFYAEGQRSPHLIIYDFFQLEKLTPFQRMKARARFWREIIPFRLHLLDHSLFDDAHYVPLEFAPHWKYQTPFNLIFQYKEETQNAILTY